MADMLYISLGCVLGVAQGGVVKSNTYLLSVLCNNEEHTGITNRHFSSHLNQLTSQSEAAVSLVPTSTLNNSKC